MFAYYSDIQWPLIALTFGFYFTSKARESLQDPKRLHGAPPEQGLLSGPGPARCRPPHVHARGRGLLDVQRGL